MRAETLSARPAWARRTSDGQSTPPPAPGQRREGGAEKKERLLEQQDAPRPFRGFRTGDGGQHHQELPPALTEARTNRSGARSANFSESALTSGCLGLHHAEPASSFRSAWSTDEPFWAITPADVVQMKLVPRAFEAQIPRQDDPESRKTGRNSLGAHELFSEGAGLVAHMCLDTLRETPSNSRAKSRGDKREKPVWAFLVCALQRNPPGAWVLVLPPPDAKGASSADRIRPWNGAQAHDV
jgi:hypothetical protein